MFLVNPGSGSMAEKRCPYSSTNKCSHLRIVYSYLGNCLIMDEQYFIVLFPSNIFKKSDFFSVIKM